MVAPPRRRKTTPRPPRADDGSPSLARLSDEALLSLRLKDVDAKPNTGLLGDCLETLREELEAKGLAFVPDVWVADEWFTPDGVPGFAVPFYLTHPRLIRLERRMMLEAEGATRRSCLRIMRHETGHAIDNAFHLQRRTRRRELFGRSGTPYPRSYYPRLFSRKYVRYLEFGYAQAHPDEDFAETFAVWLDPRSDWRRRYARWPCIDKLEYMDRLMRGLAGRRGGRRAARRRVGAAATRSTTLRQLYEAKRRRQGLEDLEVLDGDLLTLFPTEATGGERAGRTIRRLRPAVRRRVSRWTGVPQYTVERLIDDYAVRADALALHGAVPDEELDEELEKDLVALLTARLVPFVKAKRHYCRL